MRTNKKPGGKDHDTYYIGLRCKDRPKFDGKRPFAREHNNQEWFELIGKLRGSLLDALQYQDQLEEAHLLEREHTPTTILKSYADEDPQNPGFRLVEFIPIEAIDACLSKKKTRRRTAEETHQKIRNLLSS